jgi:zinc transporter ZupT
MIALFRHSLLLFAVLAAVVSLNAVVKAEEEHDEHGHEEHWEWAGVFSVTDHRLGHTLLIEKGDEIGNQNFTMAVLVLETSSGDESGLEEAEEEAEEIVEHQNATHLFGITLDISVQTLYEISVSNESWVASLNIQFPKPGYYALFLEHGMDELCAGDCFRDSDGTVLEPLFVEEAHEESDEGDDSETDWGNTMAGTFVVWSAVFSGIILLAGGSARYEALTERNVHLISMFAAGALLATAFCLILLEASHFMASSKRTEADIAGIWGSMILIGFLTATVIDIFKEIVLSLKGVNLAAVQSNNDDGYATMNTNNSEGGVLAKPHDAAGVELGTEQKGEKVFPDTKSEVTNEADVNKTAMEVAKANGIISSIVVGDFLHNFCDGVFVGAAFQSCSNTLGWTIVATTVCHEFAQEIADFIILTKLAKLSIPRALFVNAISGISVILGGIVVSASSLSDLSIGILLAFGSGNYIYLAAAELFPSVHSGTADMSVGNKLLGLGLFALGACAVGLVLLNHEHCETSGGGDESDGHNH